MGFFHLLFHHVSLFNPTFNNALLISNPIHTNLTFNSWCYPAKFFIINIPALAVYFSTAFLSKIRQYCIKHFVNFFQFIILNGAPASPSTQHHLCIYSGRKQMLH